MFKKVVGVTVGAILFGACSEPQPLASAPPTMATPSSFIVFFDSDRLSLSEQALSTVARAAAFYKTKDGARVTSTGYTDTPGSAGYDIVLCLRRANTVKEALVREGVPATMISVVGKGETQPLVQTADGVREPQNRRVEILIG